jgi:hypothetical protein
MGRQLSVELWDHMFCRKITKKELVSEVLSGGLPRSKLRKYNNEIGVYHVR